MLPIKVDIFHVKVHQDCDKPFDELSPFAQINILADHHVEQLHQQPTSSIGIFPMWLLGTTAALFHGSSLITSDIPEYIWQAAHEPPMHEYLIEWSQTATDHESKWNNDIFHSISWQHMGEALWWLSLGQWLQLSKYMNDILPTTKQLQTFDNKHDGQCFDVNNYGKIQTTFYIAPAKPENRPKMKRSPSSIPTPKNNIPLLSWLIYFVEAWNTGFTDAKLCHHNGILLKSSLWLQ